MESSTTALTFIVMAASVGLFGVFFLDMIKSFQEVQRKENLPDIFNSFQLHCVK